MPTTVFRLPEKNYLIELIMNYDERLAEIETRLAWIDETMDALDKTVAQINQNLRLQQDELRYLYQKICEQNANGFDAPANDKPPHY